MTTKPDICNSQITNMEMFFKDTLNAMESKHFLNHVSKCDKCLVHILKVKKILGNDGELTTKEEWDFEAEVWKKFSMKKYGKVLTYQEMNADPTFNRFLRSGGK